MKKIIVSVFAALLMTTFVMADQKMDNESKTTVDVSKNPITGKVTKTRKSKHKAKAKNAAGKDETVIKTDESKVEHK